MNALALLLALIVLPPCQTDTDCGEPTADELANEARYQRDRAAAHALMFVRIPDGLPIDNLEPD